VTPASESPASPFAAAASQPRNESNGAAGVLRIIRYHDSHQPDASNPDHLAARSHPFNIQFDIRPLQPEQLTWSLPHRGRQRHQVRQISFLAILRHGWRGVGLDRRRTFPFLLCQLARTRQHRPANRSQDELEVVDLNVSSTARGSLRLHILDQLSFANRIHRKRSVGPWRVRSRGMRIGVRTSPSDAGLAWSVRPSKRLALEPSPVRVFPVAPTSASTSLHVHIEGSGDGVRPHG
jgi:hypothetical protein